MEMAETTRAYILLLSLVCVGSLQSGMSSSSSLTMVHDKILFEAASRDCGASLCDPNSKTLAFCLGKSTSRGSTSNRGAKVRCPQVRTCAKVAKTEGESGQRRGGPPRPLTPEQLEAAKRFITPEMMTKYTLADGTLDYKAMSKEVPLQADYGPLDVVYEDEGLLAVSKPSGMSMNPPHRFSSGTLVNRVIGYLGKPPYVLHRLDMSTSGLVLFAKDSKLVADVHRQFRERTVRKEYLLIVDGCPNELYAVLKIKPIPRHGIKCQLHPCSCTYPNEHSHLVMTSDYDDSFSVDAAIGRHADRALMRVIDGEDPKPSYTEFEVESVSRARQVSLLRAFPKTGRTHQIRVHAQHAGLSIVGDNVYGREAALYANDQELFDEGSGHRTLASSEGESTQWRVPLKLHALKLTLQHPATGQELSVTAPPSEHFKDAMALCGLFLKDPAALKGSVR